MSKFMLSVGLLVGSLVGLAGAAEAMAPTPPLKATPTLAASSHPVGPFSSYEAAYDEALYRQSLGHRVSNPYQLSPGSADWWFDED